MILSEIESLTVSPFAPTACKVSSVYNTIKSKKDLKVKIGNVYVRSKKERKYKGADTRLSLRNIWQRRD
jgi:hypothetical protein